MVHRRGGGLENPLPERAALAGPFAERMGKKGLHADLKVLQATGRWKASSFHHPAPGGGSRLSGPGRFSPGGGTALRPRPTGPRSRPWNERSAPGCVQTAVLRGFSSQLAPPPALPWWLLRPQVASVPGALSVPRAERDRAPRRPKAPLPERRRREPLLPASLFAPRGPLPLWPVAR